MGFLVLLAVALLAVIVWIHVWIAKMFAGVAIAKGYEEEPWRSACFFIGMPAWLLVIALPNKKYHRELLDALRDERDA